jgi:outer membrane immunogenic protein
MKDFDSLGGNDVLLEKVKSLAGESKVSVVQGRVVERTHRFEISPEYGSFVGGDSYLKTKSIGLNINYHINPRWSLGLNSAYYFNELSAEALNLINDTSVTGTGIIPAIDHPKSAVMASLAWYPIYGKVSWFGSATSQFDIYGLAGAGQVQLRSGATSTSQAGIGIGLWASQHLSVRAEVKYQNYRAQTFAGPQNMELTATSVQLGYLL